MLDIMMPGIDGFTCLERLREFSNVPAILLTAKGDERDKVHGLDLGADDYLTKRLGPEEMLARVRAVLRRRQPSKIEPDPTHPRFILSEPGVEYYLAVD
jgi:DNA-binding response OmpR family regulator